MLPAIAAAGANLLGGFLGQRSEDKRNAQNIKLQKEFAQSGIQWKVADAKAAGIHPLAALGAQTASFAPVSVGGSSLAAGIGAAGQDISRAINATRPASARLDAYTKTVQDLQVQRLGLENQLLSSQIAKINQAGMPPPMPSAGDRYMIEGQGNAPLIKTSPMERSSTAPEAPHLEPGAISDTGYVRTPTGWHPVMSKDAKERLEEDMIGAILWNIRNRLGPSVSERYHKPPPGDAGAYWEYSPFTQEYRKVGRRMQ